MSDPIRLELAHSPDPDDAFMWWPITGDNPPVDTGRFRFEAVADDIESLNQLTMESRYAITAASCAQAARVADRYAVTACGSSMGDGYGPKLVAREPLTPEALAGAEIAVPGLQTTAFATLSLLLGPGSFTPRPLPFETIGDAVRAGDVAAGVVIHEGQLTYAEEGLTLVTDLGAWWQERTGEPLPLGVNLIRRDLEDQYGPGTLAEVSALLSRSVAWAMDHREEGIRYALQFARGLSPERADEFVGLYVNRWTLAFGDDGQRAVNRFTTEMAAAGLIPDVALEIV